MGEARVFQEVAPQSAYEVFSLTHRLPLSVQEIFLVLIAVTGGVDLRGYGADGRKNSDTIGNRNRILPTCSQPSSQRAPAELIVVVKSRCFKPCT